MVFQDVRPQQIPFLVLIISTASASVAFRIFSENMRPSSSARIGQCFSSRRWIVTSSGFAPHATSLFVGRFSTFMCGNNSPQCLVENADWSPLGYQNAPTILSCRMPQFKCAGVTSLRLRESSGELITQFRITNPSILLVNRTSCARNESRHIRGDSSGSDWKR